MAEAHHHYSKAIEEQLKPRWSETAGKAAGAIVLTVILGISYYPR